LFLFPLSGSNILRPKKKFKAPFWPFTAALGLTARIHTVFLLYPEVASGDGQGLIGAPVAGRIDESGRDGAGRPAQKTPQGRAQSFL
jgi:hypothetical protein